MDGASLFSQNTIQSSGPNVDYVDDLNYVIDCLNSTKKFNALMRGGVIGSPTKLWSDLNQTTKYTEDTDSIESDFNNDNNAHLTKLCALPMPKDLRSQISLLSVHLSMGILRRPVNRAWIAVDDHLFLWNMNDDDLAFFDLECVALHVDFCKAANSSRYPKHEDVDHFLVVVSCNVIKVFELRIYPTICILFSKEDSVDPMYQHKTTTDQMISVACVTDAGRIFYGTRDGRIFELILKFSTFWGNTCKAIELSGFGPGLIRSVLSPVFFSNNTEEYSRQIEQICYSEPNLLVIRRKNQVQCADLSNSWSLHSINNIRNLQVRALCIEIFTPFYSEYIENQRFYLFLITDIGNRLIVDTSNMQIILEQPASIEIGICSSAYVDPFSGICILQRSDDGAILYSDHTGSFQKLLDDGMIWAFQKQNNDNLFLTHSRFFRPKIDYLILTTNQAFTWTIPESNTTKYNSFTCQVVVMALADVLHPYWNRSLAELYKPSEETANIIKQPMISSISSNECLQLKQALNTIANCSDVADKTSDLCRLIEDVFSCWYLISVEHQLHAVVEHVTEKNREDLLKQPLRLICLPSGQQLITALLNGLIQLYLDDRAATDALLTRLKLISPKFFSPDAALLAQASDLLQKCSSLSGTFSDHSRNILAKEAINLLLRAASAVDLELWAPALLRLKLYRELVSLTVTIAIRYLDPSNLAFSYYLNNLSPEEDVDGFRLMQLRIKTYNTMLDTTTIEECRELENALLANHDDQLAHIVLFDRFMNAYNEGSLNSEIHDQFSRLPDKVLHRLNQSPYFIQYLQRCTEQEDVSTFALRSICRLFEIQKKYLNASDSLMRLSLSDSAIDIAERIALLNKALLNARNCQSKESANRIIDLENYLDIAFIQSKIADKIKALSLDDRQIRYGTLLDLTTLFQSYADPLNLYDCQLALLCMVSYNNFQLVTDLWTKICSICNSDGDYVHSTFAMLRGNGVNDERYVPVDLILRLLEERAKDLSPKVKYPGWSIEILVKYVNTMSLIKASKGYYKIGGAEFISILSEYVISSGNTAAISQMINITRDLLQSNSDDHLTNVKITDSQKLNNVHRLLEKSKQHLIFS